MSTPAESFADQIIRVATQNYYRGLRDGAGLMIDTLAEVGALSATMAAQMRVEAAKILRSPSHIA
jgi:hypothetical protein